jgi:hypothetical protein
VDAPSEAEEHLRIIRTLMERAVIYRAISAQGAIAGGVLALAAAVLARSTGWDACPVGFLALWFGVFAVAAGFNTFLLWRRASAEGQPFFSGPMRAALWAILPPMLAGGIAGLAAAFGGGDLRVCSALWVLCYGLALHAAWSFSPASLRRLGVVFLVAGVTLLSWLLSRPSALWPPATLSASTMMGATFGLFHLIYGAAVLAAGRRGHD